MEIKACRKRAGLSQQELARQAGITAQYLCCLENGKKNNPSYKLLLKIANVLKISVTELFSRKAS